MMLWKTVLGHRDCGACLYDVRAALSVRVARVDLESYAFLSRLPQVLIHGPERSKARMPIV
eukprot:8848555-Pyramimonas_sp.AAC.1